MRSHIPKDPHTAIFMRGIKKSFKQVRVLDGIDLTVQKGTVFALLGPNGAGKTTLVRILSTLLKPDDGYAAVAGYDVLGEPDAVRHCISLTGQYAAVDELLTGEENMRMIGKLYHLSPDGVRRRTAELLQLFDLADAARRIVKTYSGGMRRKLDLAISLIAAPSIIFLDEPTTGLDPRSRLAMWNRIESLKTSGTTIFLTTQYLEEADHLADKIAVIDGGRIVAEGTTDELKQRVGQEYLELVFSHRWDLEKARQIIREHILQYDEQKRSISMAIEDNPRHLKHILDLMEQAAIAVESLSLRKPTLDDVFFTLTERKATQDAGNKTNNNG